MSLHSAGDKVSLVGNNTFDMQEVPERYYEIDVERERQKEELGRSSTSLR